MSYLAEILQNFQTCCRVWDTTSFPRHNFRYDLKERSLWCSEMAGSVAWFSKQSVWLKIHTWSLRPGCLYTVTCNSWHGVTCQKTWSPSAPLSTSHSSVQDCQSCDVATVRAATWLFISAIVSRRIPNVAREQDANVRRFKDVRIAWRCRDRKLKSRVGDSLAVISACLMADCDLCRLWPSE